MKRSKIIGLLAALTIGAATTAYAGEIDNPTYKAWSKFKPGTTASYSVTTDTVAGKMTFTMTTKLDSVADGKVVLSREAMIMGNPHNAGTEDVPAKVSDEKKWPESTGTEDVKVGDKTYSCKVYDIKGPPPGSPAKNAKNLEDAVSKVWVCDEVPGGMVKVTAENKVKDKTMKSETMLTAVDVK